MSRKKRPDELMIPPAAYSKGVEVFRAWIAGEGLHISLRTGLWWGHDTVSDSIGWGIMLSDVARHIADAMQKRDRLDRREFLATVRQVFNRELDSPISPTSGRFVGPGPK